MNHIDFIVTRKSAPTSQSIEQWVDIIIDGEPLRKTFSEFERDNCPSFMRGTQQQSYLPARQLGELDELYLLDSSSSYQPNQRAVLSAGKSSGVKVTCEICHFEDFVAWKDFSCNQHNESHYCGYPVLMFTRKQYEQALMNAKVVSR